MPIFNKKPYTPEQQSALAQSLMMQSQQAPQAQMVGGQYVAPSFTQGLAQLAQGYLGGRLQNIANEREQEQSNALTQALMSDNPMASLGGLSDNAQAQKVAQEMALKKAMMTERPQARLIKGEEIGAQAGTLYQQLPTGEYKALFEPKAVDLPSSVREYEYAKNQGYAGSFNDFVTQQKRAGASTNTISVGGGKTVQVGDIPKGFQLEYNEQGFPIRMAPIPGSDPELEREQLAKKEQATQLKEQSTANLLTEDINRAKQLVSSSPYLVAGFFGNVLKDWAGTPAADLKALTETIGANISFDYLNQMRQNSPTGAALGNITEKELALLKATAGSIEQSQSPTQLTENLNRLERQFNEIINGARQQSSAQTNETIQQFSITAPNGKTYNFGSQEALNEFKQRAGL
jgi:hypothetical protein